MMEDQFALSDKLVFIYSRGSAQVHDCFEMIQLARDLTAEAFDQDVWCYTIINTNSPRMLDKPMAQGAIYFPPNGFKPPASSRSASANLSLIFSPEF
jgi:trimethylamine--corrinoid protein Co-methyltransferase